MQVIVFVTLHDEKQSEDLTLRETLAGLQRRLAALRTALSEDRAAERGAAERADSAERRAAWLRQLTREPGEAFGQGRDEEGSRAKRLAGRLRALRTENAELRRSIEANAETLLERMVGGRRRGGHCWRP